MLIKRKRKRTKKSLVASLTRRSARVRTKASRVNRVKKIAKIVKIVRRLRTVTSALVEVHLNFLDKSSTLGTLVKTKFKTLTAVEILKELL